MTCKDCPHFSVCESYGFLNTVLKIDSKWKNCKFRNDKFKYIELPCKVGDKVYAYSRVVNKIILFEIEDIHIDKNQTRYFATAFDIYYGEYIDEFEFPEDEIGQSVFHTKEEAEERLKKAEAKLKELQND
ncbi:MAG: hypothetical protein NC397_09025 [Clostridium sp.]|nr:hypothetical protein [Clostridium sp.]